MKIKHILPLLALTTPLTVNADFLSISAGAGLWNESPAGDIKKTTDTAAAIDIENDLFWDSEAQGYFFISFEHFVPFVPNVRLMHTAIDHDGSGNASFDFDGQNFSGNVSNDFSIETTDLIAYYEILDNVVSLDLGLNIRNLSIDYTIDSTGSNSTDSISATVPLLYALVGASPWPGLIISGELSFLALDGSSISDFTAKIAYTTNFLVGFEAGYRKLNFELDDISDTDANLDFDGLFAGTYIKF